MYRAYLNEKVIVQHPIKGAFNTIRGEREFSPKSQYALNMPYLAVKLTLGERVELPPVQGRPDNSMLEELSLNPFGTLVGIGLPNQNILERTL